MAELNARQLMFARLVAGGVAGYLAYQKAGYDVSTRGAEVNASRLLRNAEVQKEIKRIQARAAKKAEVTVEDLIRDHQEAVQLALAQNDIAAATRARAEIAKLTGHYAPVQTHNKTEVSGSVDVNTNQLSNEVMAALLDQDEQSPTAVH